MFSTWKPYEQKSSDLAGMMVDSRPPQVLELFFPEALDRQSGRSWLAARVSSRLVRDEAYGPNDGRHWDLSFTADVEELHDVIDFEQ